eukprot:Phypoly_transcript_05838.p1 GENE.Phypoly_transcript_05838~~Phypoly_transcript_05838.p1  ORF type:complete len:592 (+),score=72.81 Phypoly_transcript_05838:77-1852(+)
MSFTHKFAKFISKGFYRLRNPPKRFDYPRKNSHFPFLFVGYALVATGHTWYSYEVILKTGEGQKAYQNPNQMLDLATLDEHTTDISGLILSRDALPAICAIVHSGIASMESRLKALIILIETCEYNKKIRRYLIDSGELAKILDSLDTPCNMVVAKVMLLKNLSVEEDAFRMIWSNAKFTKEIFPCLLTTHLNNLRFNQLTTQQQLALVRAQLAEIRDVFKTLLPQTSNKQTGRNYKPNQIEIPSIFMDEMLPALLTEMAAKASADSSIATIMAQNDFVDILNNYLINNEPWYKLVLNIDNTADSFDDARSTLKNISWHCYKQRGWPEKEPLPDVSHPPTPQPSPLPLPQSSKTPEKIVAELKESRQLRKSWMIIFSERQTNTQVLVDGKDEVIRRMLPFVQKLGLRVVPSLESLDLDTLARAEKMMDVPVVDWEVMREHLPAAWRRSFYMPQMWSALDILQTVGPAVLGVAYGACRSFIGMRTTYRGSQALSAMSARWCTGVALRCGARTGFAVALMGVLPELSRWITCHVQSHFTTPKNVVAASIAEGIAILGTGAYLLRNCHYWFLPFLACYVAPKQVLEAAVIRIRD